MNSALLVLLIKTYSIEENHNILVIKSVVFALEFIKSFRPFMACTTDHCFVPTKYRYFMRWILSLYFCIDYLCSFLLLLICTVKNPRLAKLKQLIIVDNWHIIWWLMQKIKIALLNLYIRSIYLKVAFRSSKREFRSHLILKKLN
jgi:hypothetical protein